MTLRSSDRPFGSRYVIESVVSRGGMGVVYRALDRLNGQTVALKAVPVADGTPRETDQDATVAPTGTFGAAFPVLLSREFKIACALRHPNIISVLDYGFDAQGAPFYTMELLEGAEDIVSGTRRMTVNGKLECLAQVAEALVYLHSQGVLHRDLKPSNILIAGDRVRIVDFGISVSSPAHSDMESGSAGTLAYLADEVAIDSGAPSVRSDLYAFGIVACEVLTGRRPRYIRSSGGGRELDLSVFDEAGLPTGYDEVLERLIYRLVKTDPEQRPRSAAEVLREINQLIGRVGLLRSEQIREGFLQGSRFVGREQELHLLNDALKAARAGRSSAWIVTGESGVGKSRFVSEVRANAVSAGVLVFRGQARADWKDAYQVWQEPVRAMIVEAAPRGDDAARLAQIVPDVGSFLDAPVQAAPPLPPQQAQEELFAAVARLIADLSRPALIIIEDLHWAGAESWALLAYLTARLDGSAVVLVATFRNEEGRHLPDEIAKATEVPMKRLTRTEVRDLATAMMGADEISPQVTDILCDQSEGNVFFLVECVRSLAADDRKDDKAGSTTRLASVAAGGIRRLVNLRLERLPETSYPLIEIAALMGRRLDLDVLKKVDPTIDLESWLVAGAAASVLHVQDQLWEFAHDMLRERPILDLEPARRRTLHLQIAEAIEALPAGQDVRVVELLHHWGGAGSPEKELHYALKAIDLAIATNAIEEATARLDRAIALTSLAPEGSARDVQELRLQLQLGGLRVATSGFGAPGVFEAFSRAHDMCRRLGDDAGLVPVNWGLWSFFTVNADLDRATGLANDIERIGAISGSEGIVRLGQHLGAATQFWTGNLIGLSTPMQNFISGLRRGSDPLFDFAPQEDPEVQANSYLAWLNLLQGRPEEAERCSEVALAAARKLERRDHLAFALGFGGWYSRYRGDFRRSAKLAEELVALAEGHQFPFWLGAAKILRGSAIARRGDVAEGTAEVDEGIARWKATGAKLFLPSFLFVQAQTYLAAGDLDSADRMLREAETTIVATGERINEAEIIRGRGQVEFRRGRIEEAEVSFGKAAAVARLQGAKLFELRAAVDLAWLLNGSGRQKEATDHLTAVCSQFSEALNWSELTSARNLLAQFRAEPGAERPHP